MNKELDFYIQKTENFLDKNICNNTLKELKILKDWKEHTFYDSVSGSKHKLSGVQELDVSYSVITNTPIIMEKIHLALFNYMKHINFDWYSGWAGYTPIRFNRYEKNKKMANHCDHIHSIFPGDPKGVPILTVLGLLNDNYTGGEFMMFEDTEIKFKQGDLIIFPSNFLYPHRVEPVITGERYSFISWVF